MVPKDLQEKENGPAEKNRIQKYKNLGFRFKVPTNKTGGGRVAVLLLQFYRSCYSLIEIILFSPIAYHAI